MTTVANYVGTTDDGKTLELVLVKGDVRLFRDANEYVREVAELLLPRSVHGSFRVRIGIKVLGSAHTKGARPMRVDRNVVVLRVHPRELDNGGCREAHLVTDSPETAQSIFALLRATEAEKVHEHEDAAQGVQPDPVRQAAEALFTDRDQLTALAVLVQRRVEERDGKPIRRAEFTKEVLSTIPPFDRASGYVLGSLAARLASEEVGLLRRVADPETLGKADPNGYLLGEAGETFYLEWLERQPLQPAEPAARPAGPTLEELIAQVEERERPLHEEVNRGRIELQKATAEVERAQERMNAAKESLQGLTQRLVNLQETLISLKKAASVLAGEGILGAPDYPEETEAPQPPEA